MRVVVAVDREPRSSNRVFQWMDDKELAGELKVLQEVLE